MTNITQEEIKRLFYYEDGQLIRRISVGGRSKKGAIVGCKNNNGYLVVRIKDKLHYLHRLIFKYHHGFCPKIIDHINHIRDDNRIENLRKSTSSQNCMNTSKTCGASRFKGVFSCASTVKHSIKIWAARVTHKGKVHILGTFCLQEAAAIAYNKKAEELYGDFACLNIVENEDEVLNQEMILSETSLKRSGS